MFESSLKLGTIKSINGKDVAIYEHTFNQLSSFNVYKSNIFQYLLRTLGSGGRFQLTVDAKQRGVLTSSNKAVFSAVFPAHIYKPDDNSCIMRYSGSSLNAGLHNDLCDFDKQNLTHTNSTLTSGMLITVKSSIRDCLRGCFVLDREWQLSEITDNHLITILLSNGILPLTAPGDLIVPPQFISEA